MSRFYNALAVLIFSLPIITAEIIFKIKKIIRGDKLANTNTCPN
jgi:hypothetical protein